VQLFFDLGQPWRITVRGFCALFHASHKITQSGQGLQQHIALIPPAGELTRSHQIQDLFGGVGEGLNPIEREESGEPLDRMDGAKAGLHGVLITGIGGQRQQAAFGRLQMLPGFGDELVHKIRVIAHGEPYDLSRPIWEPLSITSINSLRQESIMHG
jgi:hypothetical protein